MTDFSFSTALMADPVFWLMLGVIYFGFTPFIFYGVAILGANIAGRPVPRFGPYFSTLLGQGRTNPEERLDALMDLNQEILARVSAASPAEPDNTAWEAEPSSSADTETPPADEDIGMGRSTAWADRRRSDRGAGARGEGYGGADPNRTYEPGTGTRASDRKGYSEELRGALRRLDILGEDLPDVAQLTRAYKDAAKKNHPDHGGSVDAFLAVKAAYDVVLKEIGAVRRGGPVH